MTKKDRTGSLFEWLTRDFEKQAREEQARLMKADLAKRQEQVEKTQKRDRETSGTTEKVVATNHFNNPVKAMRMLENPTPGTPAPENPVKAMKKSAKARQENDRKPDIVKEMRQLSEADKEPKSLGKDNIPQPYGDDRSVFARVSRDVLNRLPQPGSALDMIKAARAWKRDGADKGRSR